MGRIDRPHRPDLDLLSAANGDVAEFLVEPNSIDPEIEAKQLVHVGRGPEAEFDLRSFEGRHLPILLRTGDDCFPACLDPETGFVDAPLSGANTESDQVWRRVHHVENTARGLWLVASFEFELQATEFEGGARNTDDFVFRRRGNLESLNTCLQNLITGIEFQRFLVCCERLLRIGRHKNVACTAQQVCAALRLNCIAGIGRGGDRGDDVLCSGLSFA